MSDPLRTYSTLTADEQAAVSMWIGGFEERYEYQGAAALKAAMNEAPSELRSVLLAQLLPSLIDHDRKRQGRTPTLHELRVRFPDLAAEMTDAYPLLPAGYRLPVELRGYRVLRVVGEGGQAVVLRAQDDVHSAVAIKLSAAPEHNERLLRERELLGQCQHPGIPEVIASGVDEDRAFFVMPFLRGMTLADKHATHRPSAEEAARIGAELCDVVSHLHAQGVLHRDIKPQNVWIDESGGVKLIDLGMAIDRSSWGTSRSVVGEFHGTPAFMSPEQAASDRENDGELSDVFSIGAVLYWMGTGKAPYEGSNGQSVLGKAAEGRYEQNRLQTVSGWPKPLTRACLSAMAVEPSDRLASAAVFGECLRAPKLRLTPEGWRWGRRATAAVLTLLLLTLGSVLAVPSPARSWLKDWIASPDPSAPTRGDLSRSPGAEPAIYDASVEPAADLSVLQAEDFQLSVTCVARLIEPWGEQKRDAAVSPELVVHLNPDLEPRGATLEYRVGDLGWNALPASDETGVYAAPLSAVAAGDHDWVELQLVSGPRGRPGPIAGPFRYDFDTSGALRADEQAFGRELLKEATTEKLFDVTQPGWVVRDEYSRRLTPIIGDLWFGEDGSKPLTSLGLRLSELIKAKGNANGDRPRYDLRRAFATGAQDVQDANKLWIKIRFSSGNTFGPVLYEKPLTEAQKEKQRVLAWIERLGSDDEVAKFRGTEFVLTRLNEVLPSLTHLHLSGTRRFIDGDPSHARESIPGRKPVIEERPSSETVVDLAGLSGDRTITLPPAWSPVLLKGRFPDGTFTPTMKVRNAEMLCSCSISPSDASSPAVERELYVFIRDDTFALESESILPYVPSDERLSPGALQGCKRTSLSLASPLPDGVTQVRYYTDREFTEEVQSARPGLLYARYTDRKGATVGHSSYRISEEFMRVWIDHAIIHATPSSEQSTLIDRRTRNP